MSAHNTLINGPVNIVRLEGTVNNVKKVIYLIMDFHMGLGSQTKCPSFSSLDLYQYLATNLKNTTFPLDFMFEITQDYINRPLYEYKDIYIREVVKFFNSEFMQRGKNDKQNSLVRYHFIDVRDYVYNTINQYKYILDDIFYNINTKNNFNENDYENIKYYSNLIVVELNYWESLLFGDLDNVKKNTKQNLQRLNRTKQLNKSQVKNNIRDINKFIFKIRERYNNPDIKKKLEDNFNYISHLITTAKDFCFELVNQLEKNKKNIIVDDFILHYHKCIQTFDYGDNFCDNLDFIKYIVKTQYLLSHTLVILFANIMDIYFLRRFLDKNYIKHAIVYTGAAHSLNYLQHLLTMHDFKITHTSYSLQPNIETLNKHLEKFNNISDKREYEKNFYPPKLIQCSDLSLFPKNFE